MLCPYSCTTDCPGCDLITYWRQAEARARALYAYATAIQYVQSALQLLVSAARRDLRPAMLEALGNLYQLQEARVQAAAVYQEALALWPHTAARTLDNVRLLRKLGETVSGKEWSVKMEPSRETGWAALQEGLRLMAGEPPHGETVLLLVGLSKACRRARPIQDWDEAERYAQGDVAAAREHVTQALSAFEAMQAAPDIARTHQALVRPGAKPPGVAKER